MNRKALLAMATIGIIAGTEAFNNPQKPMEQPIEPIKPTEADGCDISNMGVYDFINRGDE